MSNTPEGTRRERGNDQVMRVVTPRLVLTPLQAYDLDWMHDLMADERGWAHSPSGAHTDLSTTNEFIDRAIAGWDRDGLSYWAARLPDRSPVGMGGVRVIDGRWNLGFRVAIDHQSRGYATEIARAALAAAPRVDALRPVIAWVDQGNVASVTVVERVGLMARGLQLDGEERLLAFTDRPVEFG